MKRMQYKWRLPAEIEARLGSESWGAQRAIFEAEHLLLVLHAPPLTDGNERDHEVFLRQPDGKWLYEGQEHGEHALARYLEEYRKVIEQLEARFDKAKEIDALFAVIDILIPLARSAAHMKDALQAAREHLGKREPRLIDMRDRAVEIARGAELLLADARLALDYRLARSAEDQARAAQAASLAQQKLNVLAAVAFPLMSVSAVFGMNLHSGIEDLHSVVFWLVFLGGVVLGVLVKSWVSTPVAATRERSKR